MPQYQDVEKCSHCGQQYFPNDTKRCPGCGSPSSQTGRKRIKFILGAGITLLILAIIAGVGYGVKHQISKMRTDEEQQRNNDSIHQYAVMLEDAKNYIHSKNLKSAAQSLKDALALPSWLDKSEASLLLKETETTAAPAEPVARSMSEEDLTISCATGTLPLAFRLNYQPLNAQYQEKMLVACYEERDRRRDLARAQAKVARDKQDGVAVPSSATGTDAGNADITNLSCVRAKIMLATGISVSGDITDCVSGEVKLNVTASAGDEGKTIIFEHRHKCSDIDNIVFSVPSAQLEKKIVKEALLVGNGVLAYNVAGLLKNDPNMRLVSDDPRLGQAMTDTRTARNDYMPLVKKVADAEIAAAYLDTQILSTDPYPSPSKYRNALEAACAAIIEKAKLNHQSGGEAAANDFRVQQDLLRAQRDSLKAQLPGLAKQRDAARALYEKSRIALAEICKDIFNKAFLPRQTDAR